MGGQFCCSTTAFSSRSGVVTCGLCSEDWPMRRRNFLSVLGGAAAWPLVARAQQGGRLRRIGMLETVPAAANAANFDAFRRGLRELGYVEGQNVTIEYRSADGRAE